MDRNSICNDFDNRLFLCFQENAKHLKKVPALLKVFLKMNLSGFWPNFIYFKQKLKISPMLRTLITIFLTYSKLIN